MILNCVVKTHRYKRTPYMVEFIKYDKYDAYSRVKTKHDNRNLILIKKVGKITTSTADIVSEFGNFRYKTIWKIYG